MASYNKYNQFIEDLTNKVHDLFGTTDTVKVLLSNTSPTAATDATKSNAAEISAGNGYTAGGEDTQNDSTRTTTTVTMTAVDITWTASVGSINSFRYPIMYNDTPTSPADPLMGYWDYGSSIAPAVGETFTVDFGASVLTFA